MHVLSCIFTISARDLPDGNYRELETSGAKQKVKGGSVAAIGFSNINAWILVITYGLCFGVELTMNNKVVMYFFNYYGLSPQIAGLLGSCFGLMNLVARSWGGLLSDVMNKKFDIRGRLWSMWIIQTLEGVMCILMGLVTVDLNGPHEPGYADSEKLQGVFNMSTYAVGDRGMVTYVINGTEGAVGPCASKLIVAKDIDYRALTDCSAAAAPDECFRDTAVPSLSAETYANNVAEGGRPVGLPRHEPHVRRPAEAARRVVHDRRPGRRLRAQLQRPRAHLHPDGRLLDLRPDVGRASTSASCRTSRARRSAWSPAWSAPAATSAPSSARRSSSRRRTRPTRASSASASSS